MERAFRLYSQGKGFMKEEVKAMSIKSRSDARKLGPFLDKDKILVMWVSWSKPIWNESKEKYKKRKPHFRRYPTDRINRNLKRQFKEEIKERKKSSGESPIHKKAKLELASYLKNLLSEKRPLEWHFKDERMSDFNLNGNLLRQVVTIQEEYEYETPFGVGYKFDIALLGRSLREDKEPIILGVIELEKTNRFPILKCLISKSLGFPLVSINIEDLKLDEIDENWVRKSISESRNTAEEGQRKNYIYIHNSLYPTYMKIPKKIRKDDKHQFIIFIDDDKYEKLCGCLEYYKSLLGFSGKDLVDVGRPKLNPNDNASIRSFSNEGSIAGADWRDYNENRFIRLTMKCPSNSKEDDNLYLYHLIVARLLNCHFNTLVGYKYCRGLKNDDMENEIWEIDNLFHQCRIINKQVSEPIKPIIDHFEEIGILDKFITVPE